MYDFKGFYEQNRDYCRAFIIVAIICITGIWLCYDYHRNEPIYNNTDGTMDDIEKRVDSIESGLDNLSGRITKTQKTIGRAYVTVNEGKRNAESIAEGVGRIEDKLDSAIQRSGRIANLIADIERANQPGKASASETSLAK